VKPPLSEEFEYVNFYEFVFIPLRVNSKEPAVKGWDSLTKDELRALIKPNMNMNVGVRTDKPLFIIDVDDSRLRRLVEDDFPQTLTVKTRRGYHYYFIASGRYPKPNKKSRLIQLLSGECYSVFPHSIVDGHTYTFEMKAPIVKLDDHAVEKLERIIDVIAENETLILKLSELWTEGHRHRLSLWLNGCLRKAGFEKFDAAVLIKTICLLASDSELRDRLEALRTTFERPINEVGGWSYLKQELEGIVGPERAKEILALIPHRENEGDSEKTKKKLRYITGGEVIDRKLVEVVEGPALLIYDGVSFEVKPEFETENEILKPYPHLPFALPRPPDEIREDPSLWDETKAFIHEYYDNPGNEHVYDLLTSLVAWSYFIHEIKISTPYLCFLGPWRSGKTRGLEVLSALCHKPMFVVDPSEASVFRMIETFKPTLLVDETQIIDPNVRALFAAGYRYGVKIPRVVDPEADGLDGIKFFDCFGLKIYASREQPPDDIYSRSIIIHCERNIRSTSKRIDEARALELRTRWLAQRLRMFGKIGVTYEEFKSEDGRLQELLSPLIVMAEIFGGPSAKQAVEAYGRLVEAEIAGMESDTPEADVIQALVDIITEKKDDAPTYVQVSEITERLNGGNPKGEWTPEKVGRRLATLGFKRLKLPGGKRAYHIDYPLLERLIRRYRINADLSLEGLLAQR